MASRDFGKNVKHQLFTEPLERARKQAHSVERRESAALAHASELGMAAADAVLLRLSVRARHARRVWYGLPRLLPRHTFAEIAIGPADLRGLGHFSAECGRKEETQPLRGLIEIAESTAWLVPYAGVCLLAAKPDLFMVDAKGRLHCADGPALRYADGGAAYVWKGVEVSDWMIEHPERITCDDIAAEVDPERRNAMIDIMTPERFVRSGDPQCISRDDSGTLWFRRWTFRGATIGTWAAVEVDDDALEWDRSRKRHFLRVPSHIRTARDAVAWTHHGLTAT